MADQRVAGLPRPAPAKRQVAAPRELSFSSAWSIELLLMLAADLRKLTRGRRQTASEVLQREGRTER